MTESNNPPHTGHKDERVSIREILMRFGLTQKSKVFVWRLATGDCQLLLGA